MGSAPGLAPVPPSDLDAEESVLGALMISQAALPAVVEAGLRPGDFYRASHGIIYDAALALYTDGEPIDAITVADRLAETGKLDAAGGRPRIHEIAVLVPSAGNVGHYAAIVKEMALLRGLITVGGSIERLGWERPDATRDLLERAEKLVFDLTMDRGTGDSVTLRDAVREAFDRIEELGKLGREIVGLPTGLRWLDRITSGLQRANLIVLAARPSMGKSALALGIVASVVKENLPVALFTLEMSSGEVTQRLLSSEAYVDATKIRNGKLDADEWKRVTAAAGRLSPSPLLIDDSGLLTALELRSKARRIKMRHPDLALVVVDYIQLMTSGSRTENRVQDVSTTSRTLKVLASELDVPVLALSQLSRQVEQRHDKRPLLSDLRESGALEQDADVVLMLYRDDYYNEDDEQSDQRGIAEVNVAKHRNGPTGVVKLSWSETYTRFGDLA